MKLKTRTDYLQMPWAPWHGYRAKDSFEWDYRMAIRHKFWEFAKDFEKRNPGTSYTIDSTSIYESAVRAVRNALPPLPPGYAVVFIGNTRVR